MFFWHYTKTEGFSAKEAHNKRTNVETFSITFSHRLFPFFHRLPSLFLNLQWRNQVHRLLYSALHLSPYSSTPTSTLISSWPFLPVKPSPISKVKPIVHIQFQSHFVRYSFTYHVGFCFAAPYCILSNGLCLEFSVAILLSSRFCIFSNGLCAELSLERLVLISQMGFHYFQFFMHQLIWRLPRQFWDILNGFILDIRCLCLTSLVLVVILCFMSQFGFLPFALCVQ